MRKYIEVKLDVEAIHCWPNCNIDEVAYLKHPHRHTFQFICRVEVTHNERDVEFIELKHKLKQYLGSKYYSKIYKCCDFGSMSCESLAEDVLTAFGLVKCIVSEDGEFFGICER